jgi:hypothetical protein
MGSSPAWLPFREGARNLSTITLPFLVSYAENVIRERDKMRISSDCFINTIEVNIA